MSTAVPLHRSHSACTATHVLGCCAACSSHVVEWLHRDNLSELIHWYSLTDAVVEIDRAVIVTCERGGGHSGAERASVVELAGN